MPVQGTQVLTGITVNANIETTRLGEYDAYSGNQLSASDTIRLISESANAVQDLGAIPMTIGTSEEVGDWNDAVFAKWAESLKSTKTARALKLTGRFRINNTLVLPNNTGACIICEGGSPAVNESELVKEDSTLLGGHSVGFVWGGALGAGSGPILKFNGLGVRVIGTLCLAGRWHATDDYYIIGYQYGTSTPLYSDFYEEGVPEIGLLVEGVDTGSSGGIGQSTRIGLGYHNIDNIHILACKNGIQYGSEIHQNNSDNCHVGFYFPVAVKNAIYLKHSQAVNHTFTNIRQYPVGIDTDNNVLVYAEKSCHCTIDFAEIYGGILVYNKRVDTNNNLIKFGNVRVDNNGGLPSFLISEVDGGPINVYIDNFMIAKNDFRRPNIDKPLVRMYGSQNLVLSNGLVLEAFSGGSIEMSELAAWPGETDKLKPRLLIQNVAFHHGSTPNGKPKQHPSGMLNLSKCTGQRIYEWKDCYTYIFNTPISSGNLNVTTG